MTDQQSRLPATAAVPERPGPPGPHRAARLRDRLWDLRLVGFGTVAVSCTLLQLAILVGGRQPAASKARPAGVATGPVLNRPMLPSDGVACRPNQA